MANRRQRGSKTARRPKQGAAKSGEQRNGPARTPPVPRARAARGRVGGGGPPRGRRGPSPGVPGAPPADLGMAIVLVQHLAPQHESALPVLLGSVSALPVVQVTEGMHIEPNHVYVIPP